MPHMKRIVIVFKRHSKRSLMISPTSLPLPRSAKIVTLTLLMPLLAFSLMGLSAMVACDIPDAINHRQLSRELCTLQQGQYSVHLVWEDIGRGCKVYTAWAWSSGGAFFPVFMP